MLGVLCATAAVAGSATAEPVTIVALGDSLTQGYGLVPQEGLVPQLEAWLRDHGAEVTVVNAGVSGDTTAGGLSRIGWTLNGEVDGLIVALGGNDLLRGLDPALSQENLAGILAAAQAQEVEVLLVAMEAAGNFGPDYKAAFDGMYGALAAEYQVTQTPPMFDFLRQAGAENESAADLRKWVQADGIHPNAQGVSRIVAGLGPYVLDMASELGACASGCDQTRARSTAD